MMIMFIVHHTYTYIDRHGRYVYFIDLYYLYKYSDLKLQFFFGFYAKIISCDYGL